MNPVRKQVLDARLPIMQLSLAIIVSFLATAVLAAPLVNPKENMIANGPTTYWAVEDKRAEQI